MWTAHLPEESDALNQGDLIADLLFPKVSLPLNLFKLRDMDAGAWSCGMVAGLVHDVPTVRELVDRIMREAQEIIEQRLAGMLR